jgi:hypothetical protein
VMYCAFRVTRNCAALIRVGLIGGDYLNDNDQSRAAEIKKEGIRKA